jgi:hypothetical protein
MTTDAAAACICCCGYLEWLRLRLLLRHLVDLLLTVARLAPGLLQANAKFVVLDIEHVHLILVVARLRRRPGGIQARIGNTCDLQREAHRQLP